MRDAETRSLWSHILGEAMQGPLKGKRLEQVPAVMTDWESWRRAHPNTTVVLLSRTSRDYTRRFYAQPKKFVLGIVLEGKAYAWGFDTLVKSPASNEKIENKPVLVAFDRQSLTGRLFERKLDDKVLRFVLKDGRLSDRQSGSTWDPVTGKALAGPLAGKYLKPLPAIVSFRTVWQRFHPKGYEAKVVK